ncbi:hypothetical protein AB7952_00030 [Streptomyces sp. PG2]
MSNSIGSEGSLERCEVVVWTEYVTVAESLAWLCVMEAVAAPSTARTAVPAPMGQEPVQGAWKVR